MVPMETLGLGETGGNKRGAAILIEQDVANSARNIENIIRTHQLRGIAHRFYQRWKIGRHHRRAAGHGFQRRETETFIKRGKSEGGGGAIKHTQRVRGDKSQKTNKSFDPARHHGTANTGILRQLIADNYQA
jgi:hypothetical protein